MPLRWSIPSLYHREHMNVRMAFYYREHRVRAIDLQRFCVVAWHVLDLAWRDICTGFDDELAISLAASVNWRDDATRQAWNLRLSGVEVRSQGVPDRYNLDALFQRGFHGVCY